jgi:hypothetical protein
MALSTTIKHYTDGTLTVKDGTGTPLSATSAFYRCDVSVSGWSPQASNRAVVAYQTKGALRSVRLGDQEFPTVTFSVVFTEWGDDASTATFDSAIRFSGVWASAVSTLGSTAEAKAVDIVWTVEGTDHGDAADHTLTMTDVVITSMVVSEGSPTAITYSGTVYGTITPSA